jgi:hypothetical protein
MLEQLDDVCSTTLEYFALLRCQVSIFIPVDEIHTSANDKLEYVCSTEVMQ